ncbi:MAG: T9SS type A sorting domain-containing protein [Candidatus Zixiibacteriota bacterium]|nr:MAG: T9SS type A sorting domain-containing protein [candidate division Zixibacteria bacterium]
MGRFYIYLPVGALIILLAGGAVMSAESIRITSDIDSESASFDVKSKGIDRTEVSLDMTAVEITPVSLNNTDYLKVQLPAAEYLFGAEIAEDGMPDLPAVTTNIAVPDMAGIDFTVEYESFEIIDDVEIAPTQPPVPESGEDVPPFTINSEFYSRDEFYPGDIAEVKDPVILRDVRMAQVVMYPVHYNPARKQLKIYRNISVNLSYDGEDVVNPKTHRRGFISEAFLPIYKAILPNFDELYATENVQRGGYLILVKDIFADSLKAFANWKRRKGYHVHIAPTTEIDPSGGTPTQMEVYNYIRDAYLHWEIPPEFVMIVGDVDNTGYSGITDYPYNYYTSDHSYSELEGSDYMPDLSIARFSIDNMSELRIALGKALDYDSNPYMEEINHWRRGLSVAGNVAATTPRITVLWVRSLLLEYGFTDVDTSFRWSPSTPDPYLLGYFNEGPCIISYRGWAFTSGWSSPQFRISDLLQIQNHNKLGIMASIVCGTCDYGMECFCETWLRMGSTPTIYKGGPAVWGTTDHGTGTRWNNPLMVGYYWGIFKENNYHFASAAIRGKIQQYNTFPRYNSPGGTVEKYFHTYNMLGDPEIGVRTKPPVFLSVIYQDQIELGLNSLDINVMDNSQNVIEGAYVTLYKEAGGQEELWSAGRTDANGDVTLSFDPQTAGEMILTVSGRDLFPYQGHIEIIDSDAAVGYDSHAVDDDNNGHSSGNDDGIANPGEIIELTVDLKNFGGSQTASGVEALMEAIEGNPVTIYSSESDFGDILPGQTAPCSTPYVVMIHPTAADGEIGGIKITATDSNNNSWESALEIPIEAPRLRVGAVTFPGGNGRLDPGETLNMVLTVQNLGSTNAPNVTATVSTFDDYTSLTTSNCTFGDIPSGGSADNSGNPLVISSDPETFEGHNINLILHAQTSSGVESDIPFTVFVGQVSSTDPTGPDAYGYHIFDNTDTGYDPVPSYSWVEIVPDLGGQGTRLSYNYPYDDESNVIILPFDFVYYGRPYEAMIVCINGFAALDTVPFDMGGNYWYNFYNWPIPDPGSARGQISPFWDDLSYTGTVNGVYTWYDSDNHRFIIQWHMMTHRNTSVSETFQMIITDPQYRRTLTGDSEIMYQYKSIINNDSYENYCSVGFESWDELMGLEYTYDNFYKPGAATLGNYKALKITTNTGRGGIRGTVDLNHPGDNGGVTVSTSDGRYRITDEDGLYWIKNVPPGAVDVAAEIRGWFPMTTSAVNVMANATTDSVNFNLTQCDIPANLDASEGLGDRIELTWNAISHPDLAGYNIYRSNWENGDYVKLNTTPVANANYTDNTIPDNHIYWYAVTAAYTGSYGDAESMESDKAYGSTDFVTGAGDKSPAIPELFFLSQNYPNPFNPYTTLSYGLPKDSHVRINIFNILGQQVVTLVDERQTAGYRSVIWNGKDGSDGNVSSGIYFYTIEAGDYRASKKMLLIK